MPRSLVAVNAQGRLTLPAEVRRTLGIGEGSQLEVGVENDEIRLRPARLVVSEDAWAYTAGSLRSIRRALADIKAGRVSELDAEDLERRTSRRRARKR